MPSFEDTLKSFAFGNCTEKERDPSPLVSKTNLSRKIQFMFGCDIILLNLLDSAQFMIKKQEAIPMFLTNVCFPVHIGVGR
jgi:hypothetical protein